MSKQWKMVDHPTIPGMISIEGLAFRIVICTQATDVNFSDYLRIMADARLLVAAPEMFELIEELSKAYDDDKSGHDLALTLYDLRCMALRLLAKIKGGDTNANI